MDFLQRRAQTLNTTIDYGRMVLLPQSFEQSTSCMYKRFLDAMTLVRKFGIPDYFITSTTNPKWVEITETIAETSPGLSWYDRPDVVSRVFYLRWKELWNLIRSGVALGTVVAMTSSFEFQKRGLPHNHLILWMHPNFKVRSPQVVDAFISATIPREDDPEEKVIRGLVTSHQLHNLCGEQHHGAPCMKHNRCSKYYPKPFRDETVMQDERGCVAYRRPNDDSVFIDSAGRHYNNMWVVSYVRLLLLKWGGHLHVDACNKVNSVFYLCKYLYKG